MLFPGSSGAVHCADVRISPLRSSPIEQSPSKSYACRCNSIATRRKRNSALVKPEATACKIARLEKRAALVAQSHRHMAMFPATTRPAPFGRVQVKRTRAAFFKKSAPGELGPHGELFRMPILDGAVNPPCSFPATTSWTVSLY